MMLITINFTYQCAAYQQNVLSPLDTASTYRFCCLSCAIFKAYQCPLWLTSLGDGTFISCRAVEVWESTAWVCWSSPATKRKKWRHFSHSRNRVGAAKRHNEIFFSRSDSKSTHTSLTAKPQSEMCTPKSLGYTKFCVS